MRNYIFLIATAAIYVILKEALGLHGISGGIICGAIAGAAIGAIAWLVERHKKQDNESGKADEGKGKTN